MVEVCIRVSPIVDNRRLNFGGVAIFGLRRAKPMLTQLLFVCEREVQLMNRSLQLLLPLCALLICQSCVGQTAPSTSTSGDTKDPPYYEVQLRNYKAGEFPGVGSRDKWDQANAEYQQCLSLYESGLIDASLQKCDAALKIYPYEPRYYESLGRILIRQGDEPGAIRAYKKAVKLDESNWYFWRELANCYNGFKKYEHAANSYDEALRRNPPEREIRTLEAFRNENRKLATDPNYKEWKPKYMQ